ncbi:hypothetical protein H0H92_014212 [Tricholoma furcatifolium]|nr:hypothetical protein H0H92_014212 [Tricholoma furcatifolium]
MLHGLASGLETILPAAFTSPQPQLVGLWTQRMAVVMAIALIPICFIWNHAEHIFLALKQDPEVSRLAASYLRVMSVALPASAWNIISRRYFQSQRLFAVQTKIIAFVAPINILGNFALVWGPEPIRLGFIGAPIATMISFYLIAIASYIYGRYYIPRTAWHPLSMKMFSNLGILVRLGISGVAQVTSSWWAWEFSALATSYMGPTSLACQSILMSTSTIMFQLHFSNANAATIRIGNLLGEKNAERAHAASRAGLVIAIISASITRLFNDDPNVVELVSTVIPFIAFYQFVDGQQAMASGFLRVRGKQLSFLQLNKEGLLFKHKLTIMTGLPLGFWLAFNWDLGLPGLWTGLTLAIVINGVTTVALCFRTDWNKEVVKVIERNSREEMRQKAKLADEENML